MKHTLIPLFVISLHACTSPADGLPDDGPETPSPADLWAEFQAVHRDATPTNDYYIGRAWMLCSRVLRARTRRSPAHAGRRPRAKLPRSKAHCGPPRRCADGARWCPRERRAVPSRTSADPASSICHSRCPTGPRLIGPPRSITPPARTALTTARPASSLLTDRPDGRRECWRQVSCRREARWHRSESHPRA